MKLRRSHASALPLDRAGRRLTVLVLVLGVILSAGFYTASHHRPAVYWSRVQVRFIAPQSTRYPNVLRISSGSLVSTVAIVAQTIDPYGSDNRMASETTTLADEGIKNGWSVTLPNTGGQWANAFADPWVDVQAVGPDPAGVQDTMVRLVAQVNQTLTDIQQKADVKLINRITTQATPTDVPVYYQQGSAKRAAVMSLLLGFAFAGMAGTWYRRRMLSPVTGRARLARRWRQAQPQP